MTITFNEAETAAIAQGAEQLGISQDQLIQRYRGVMEANFVQDMADVINELGIELNS